MTVAPQLVGPSSSSGGPVPSSAWDELLADIGDRIRAERKARRWSQDELAQQAGLGRSTVRGLEDGIGSLRSFTRVCWALNVDMAYLLSDQWQLPARRPSLTEAQSKVLRAVADGRPLAVAALELGMARDGLASRMSEIYRRLGVADVPRQQRRAAAVRVASSHGLIDAA